MMQYRHKGNNSRKSQSKIQNFRFSLVLYRSGLERTRDYTDHKLHGSV